MGVVAKRFLDAVPSLKKVVIRWTGRRPLPIDVVDVRLWRRKDPTGEGEIVERKVNVLIHEVDVKSFDGDEEMEEWEADDEGAANEEDAEINDDDDDDEDDMDYVPYDEDSESDSDRDIVIEDEEVDVLALDEDLLG